MLPQLQTNIWQYIFEVISTADYEADYMEMYHHCFPAREDILFLSVFCENVQWTIPASLNIPLPGEANADMDLKSHILVACLADGCWVYVERSVRNPATRTSYFWSIANSREKLLEKLPDPIKVCLPHLFQD